MKRKIIAGFAITFFIIVVSIYLFIPSNIQVSQIQRLSVPSGAALRCLNSTGKIKSWWPGKVLNERSSMFTDGNYSFTFSKFSITEIQKIVVYDTNNDSLQFFASLNPTGRDSSFLQWSGTMKSSLFPFARINQYMKAIKLKKSIEKILKTFASYTSNTVNIYGISIGRERVPDSLLISEKKDFSYYPRVQEIYSGINSLRQYISEQQATQTNYPICNITPKDSSVFSLIVAIPVNKKIKEKGIKKMKNLLYNGNILVTEIKGGDYKINQAMEAMNYYIKDYQLTPAVLPYQSLLTDREKVGDSSIWTTKVCFPIY
jgi:hypothetical protein